MNLSFRPSSHRLHQRGFALVVTLIVIALLTVIVVAFSSSTGTDRSASRALMNRTRAEAAAEAGLAEALAQFGGLTDFRFVTVQPLQPGKALPRGQKVDPKLFPYLRRLTSSGTIDANQEMVSLASKSSASLRSDDLAPRIVVNGKVTLSSDWKTLDDGSLASPREIARYAFFVDEAGSKQNVSIASGSGPRQALAQLGEIPLVGAPLSVEANPEPTPTRVALGNRSLLITAASANQVDQFPQAPAPADNYSFTTSSPAVDLRPDGKPKLDLKKLKVHVDSLPTSQGVNNPRSQLVDHLLDDSYPGTEWGGGNLSFLSSLTRYSPTQRKQIVANLLDYIDEDMVPTTDNGDKPTYFGVEGKLNSSNKVEGHPVVTFIGTGTHVGHGARGVITRLWTIVAIGVANPTDVQINWRNYSVDPIEVQYEGTVSDGSNINNWFPSICNQNLDPPSSSQPITIDVHSGIVRPGPYTTVGAQKRDFKGEFVPPSPPPLTLSFTGVKQRLKKLIIRCNVGTGAPYIVQNFGELSTIPVSHSPQDILPTSNSTDVTYRLSETGGDSKMDFHLNGDPRLNFKASSWKLNTSRNPTASSPTGTLTPIAVYGTASGGRPAEPTPFAQLDLTNSDFSSIPPSPNQSDWYRGSDFSGNFYVSSPPKGVAAVRSVGDLGYLHTGIPWETLRLYVANPPSSSPPNPADKERDLDLLAHVKTGSLETAAYGTIPNSAASSLPTQQAAVNLNTGKSASFAALLLGSTADSDATADARANGMVPDPDFSSPDPSASTLWQAIINAQPSALNKLPFVTLREFLRLPEITVVTSRMAKDFDREALARRTANAVSFQSTRFTVYAVGEARETRGVGAAAVGTTTAIAALEAEIELRADSSGKPVAKIVRRMFR